MAHQDAVCRPRRGVTAKTYSVSLLVIRSITYTVSLSSPVDAIALHQMNSPARSSADISLPLSRDRILNTALRIADEDGIEALSMRRIAQALGVKAMSLYNHVKNKDEIISGIVDRVMGEIDVPDITADWKVTMRQRAISAHAMLMRHPWAALTIMAGVNVGPAALRYVDATLGCLRQAGFSWEMADHAWNAMDSHIYGFTLQALNFPFDEAEYADVASAFVSQIPSSTYPFLNGLTQEVIARRYSGIHTFEFGLDLLLDGLDRLRDAAP